MRLLDEVAQWVQRAGVRPTAGYAPGGVVPGLRRHRGHRPVSGCSQSPAGRRPGSRGTTAVAGHRDDCPASAAPRGAGLRDRPAAKRQPSQRLRTNDHTCHRVPLLRSSSSSSFSARSGAGDFPSQGLAPPRQRRRQAAVQPDHSGGLGQQHRFGQADQPVGVDAHGDPATARAATTAGGTLHWRSAFLFVVLDLRQAQLPLQGRHFRAFKPVSPQPTRTLRLGPVP